MRMLVMVEHPPPVGACDCPPNLCRFSIMRLRAYLIAYREASKCGEDPADYIRDSMRGSRNVIEPWVRGGKDRDPYDATDVKLALEQVAHQHGIALNPQNAERIARVLCPERHLENLV